jgi:hypothetical protein
LSMVSCTKSSASERFRVIRVAAPSSCGANGMASSANDFLSATVVYFDITIGIKNVYLARTTGVATPTDLVPVAFPLFSPLKGAVAGHTDFRRVTIFGFGDSSHSDESLG